jgi:hypothetical protein
MKKSNIFISVKLRQQLKTIKFSKILTHINKHNVKSKRIHTENIAFRSIAA